LTTAKPRVADPQLSAFSRKLTNWRNLTTAHPQENLRIQATLKWHAYCKSLGWGREMLKIEKESDGRVSILRLIGRVESEHIGELERLIARSTQKLVLDLEEVTLVNREVVGFFGVCEATGIELRNCPAYIRAWTQREQDK
jgi:hypothetical protein